MPVDKDSATARPSSGDGKEKPAPATGGEDENSTEKEGDDGHLNDDQKAPTLPT